MQSCSPFKLWSCDTYRKFSLILLKLCNFKNHFYSWDHQLRFCHRLLKKWCNLCHERLILPNALLNLSIQRYCNCQEYCSAMLNLWVLYRNYGTKSRNLWNKKVQAKICISQNCRTVYTMLLTRRQWIWQVIRLVLEPQSVKVCGY